MLKNQNQTKVNSPYLGQFSIKTMRICKKEYKVAIETCSRKTLFLKSQQQIE